MNDTFEYFKSMGKDIDIKPHLFWAGRLSIAAKMVVDSKTSDLSETIELLDLCRKEYDKHIINLNKSQF